MFNKTFLKDVTMALGNILSYAGNPRDSSMKGILMRQMGRVYRGAKPQKLTAKREKKRKIVCNRMSMKVNVGRSNMLVIRKDQRG